jgi:hypothetical protein
MRRIACALALLTVLILPTAASVWVQSATYDVPDGGSGVCLRPAGVGAVSLFGSAGATTSTNLLLHVAPGSITPGPTTTLGWQMGCAEASGGPTPLLAAAVWNGRATVAAVAPAGGRATAFPAQATPAPAGTVVVAQSATGAAIAAWSESRVDSVRSRTQHLRMLAAVRAPGADAFGPPITLSSADDVPLNDAGAPAVGIDDAGDAVVAWGQPEPSGLATWVTTIAAGTATASPAQRFDGGGTPALSVSPGGRALLATGGGDVLERSGADAAFVQVPLLGVGGAGEFSVALNDDGAAVVGRHRGGGTAVWLRPPGGAFGAAQQLTGSAAAVAGGDEQNGIVLWETDAGRPKRPTVPNEFLGLGRLQVLLTGDGRVLVTWIDGDALGLRKPAHVLASEGRVDGTMPRATAVSSACIDPLDAYPLELPGGQLGVVWSDPLSSQRVTARGVGPRPPGRIHLSLPGTPPAPTHPPRLSARYVGPSALRASQSALVRVSCSGAPCGVRAATSQELGLPDGFPNDPFSWNADDTALAVGASRTLRVTPFVPSDHPANRPHRHPIVVSACDGQGVLVAHRTLRPVLRQLPPRPVPRIVDLHARRAGSDVLVSWRTTAPARDLAFVVFVLPRSTGRLGDVRGRGRTHHHLTLHHVPRSARRIQLFTSGGDGASQRTAQAPIR